MLRHLESNLVSWKDIKNRNPLLIRGARQIGKSYLVRYFGQKYFKNTIEINFELNPIYKSCFQSLHPSDICTAISAISEQRIIPGETLLFLDEIQDCPAAIQSLRYFKENYPELHVIGAGSLLELVLNNSNFRMPVGRITSYYMYPLSFKEFLIHTNKIIQQELSTATINKPPLLAIHEQSLVLLKKYLLTGGMPEAIAVFLDTKSTDQLQSIQAGILQTYQNDFGHYTNSDYNINKFKLSDLKVCYKQIPYMIGQQIKYNKIDENIKSRDLKTALSILESASIIQQITCSQANGLPIDASLNQKKFKLNFVDVGLVKRVNQLDTKLLLNTDIMLLNNGALAEQFVGQELLAYASCSRPYEKPNLYFWARDGFATAEVDYLTVIGDQIIPVEVKAGKIGTLRSLKQFMLEHKSTIGIKISMQPLSFENNVLSLPLYMISELERIVNIIS